MYAEYVRWFQEAVSVHHLKNSPLLFPQYPRSLQHLLFVHDDPFGFVTGSTVCQPQSGVGVTALPRQTRTATKRKRIQDTFILFQIA